MQERIAHIPNLPQHIHIRTARVRTIHSTGGPHETHSIPRHPGPDTEDRPDRWSDREDRREARGASARARPSRPRDRSLTAPAPSAVLDHPQLKLIEASILALSDELAACVEGCDVVVSCLGHVLSFRGVFGAPRRLCTEATERLCAAIEAQAPAARTKFILMNTVGVPNPDLPETRSRMERLLLFSFGGCSPLTATTRPPRRTCTRSWGRR